MVRDPGNYWHMFPTEANAKKAVWRAVNHRTKQRRIFDAFPRELMMRRKPNETEKYIEFYNQATYQILGSDNHENLPGAGPKGIVLSEWSRADPNAMATLNPMIRESQGWIAVISTPCGKNHYYDLFKAAQKDDSWFVSIVTAEQSGVFTKEELDDELKQFQNMYGSTQGDALFRQEYLCSFDVAFYGSIFADEIADVRASGRIVPCKPHPEDRSIEIMSAWDIGKHDSTAVWFFYLENGKIFIVDYFEDQQKLADYYILECKKRWPHMKKCYWPHDGKVEEWIAGSRVEAFKKHGLYPEIVPRTSIIEGIQATRARFSDLVFDTDVANGRGFEHLCAYRIDYNEKLGVLAQKPVHDKSSHAADALKYLCLGIKDSIEKKNIIVYPKNKGVYLTPDGKLFADLSL